MKHHAHSQHYATDNAEQYAGTTHKMRPMVLIDPVTGMACFLVRAATREVVRGVTWEEFDPKQLYEESRRQKREPVDPSEIVTRYPLDAHHGHGPSWMECEPAAYQQALQNATLYRKAKRSDVNRDRHGIRTVTPRAA